VTGGRTAFVASVANVVNRLLTRLQPVTTEEFAMKYVGVDLHKQVISVCVVIQEDGKKSDCSPQFAL
jgi:hypothetical protein